MEVSAHPHALFSDIIFRRSLGLAWSCFECGRWIEGERWPSCFYKKKLFFV